ncbi:reverse transcriptase domain, reverse transcriptase zinc-binding domain protein [Tanacetum coccineum]|uniref:Reverse transcriptase domain, reverse transcriptase zinc-binding domain protein n=1 Tax=Tanacetum coccineum TaxID=301880 RepID=A0ABQ5BY65_9ASTR
MFSHIKTSDCEVLSMIDDALTTITTSKRSTKYDKKDTVLDDFVKDKESDVVKDNVQDYVFGAILPRMKHRWLLRFPVMICGVSGEVEKILVDDTASLEKEFSGEEIVDAIRSCGGINPRVRMASTSKVSGLRVNYNKSKLYGVGVIDSVLRDMARWMRCGVGDFPFTYLGLLIGNNMRRVGAWNSDIVMVEVDLEGLGLDFSSSFVGEVGNGRDIRFWTDRWVDEVRLCDRFPRLYHLDRQKEGMMAEKGNWVKGAWCWEWEWVRDLRGRVYKEFEDFQILIQNMVIMFDCRDRWRWTLHKNEDFIVKELKKLMEENILDVNNGGDATIWNKWVPKKVNIFVWRALKGRLSVREELDKRGIDLDSILCPSCGTLWNIAVLKCGQLLFVWFWRKIQIQVCLFGSANSMAVLLFAIESVVIGSSLFLVLCPYSDCFYLVKDDMIYYVLHKYGSNWQVHNAIADDILDDLLRREWEKQQCVKYDKRNVIEMKILELLEQRIEKVEKHLNKEKHIMVINKGKEKMVMERATSDESSDQNPFQATSDESSDHNPFQATSDESSDHNPFQVSSDDTLKSSSKDTCSSDSTWE